MAQIRTFSDIDLSFTRHPVTGDIAKKYDEAAIKSSIRNLIMTMNWERLFHSEIGTEVKRSLFELAGPLLTIRVQRSVEDCIRNFEPRVVLNFVDVSYVLDSNSMNINVNFTIINTTQPLSVDLILDRTR